MSVLSLILLFTCGIISAKEPSKLAIEGAEKRDLHDAPKSD